MASGAAPSSRSPEHGQVGAPDDVRHPPDPPIPPGAPPTGEAVGEPPVPLPPPGGPAFPAAWVCAAMLVAVGMEDEPRTEIVSQPDRLTPELFVPVVGKGAAAQQVRTGAWLQRLSDAVADACPAPTDGTACATALESLPRELRSQVVVAAPLTRPAVEAPLGWTLSPDSRTRLDQALADQVDDCHRAPSPGGYPCLTDLLSFLGGRT